MAAIVTFYNHTRKRVLAGEFPETDTYKLNLYSALPVNAAATTKAAAESGGTQISTANGYTQDAKVISGLAVSIVATANGKLTFDPVEWDAVGGSIAGSFGLIFDDTQADDPPYAHIDFGGTITAVAGTKFRINPHTDGFLLLN